MARVDRAAGAPSGFFAAAEEDDRSDAEAALKAARSADAVYRLFGEVGYGDLIGYHRRAGERGQNQYDWQQYLDFADRHFKKP